ncbi:MAG: cyclic nucleotide-binding domain-containing protein [Burkholderiaceae bacterium]
MTLDTYSALRASKLAVELSDQQCRNLAAALTLQALHDGEVLVKEGSSDDRLFAVVSGALGVIKDSPDGQVTLHTLTAGDLAGELSFLDGTVRYASLVALGPSQVLLLSRTELEALLADHPEVVYRVMRAIMRTVHAIQRRLSIQQSELSNYIYKQHGRY